MTMINNVKIKYSIKSKMADKTSIGQGTYEIKQKINIPDLTVVSALSS